MKLFFVNFLIFIRAKLLAVKRRLYLLIYKEFNPYPNVFDNIYLSPSEIIYKKDRVEDNLILIKGNKGYTYYPNLMWPMILTFFTY